MKCKVTLIIDRVTTQGMNDKVTELLKNSYEKAKTPIKIATFYPTFNMMKGEENWNEAVNLFNAVLKVFAAEKIEIRGCKVNVQIIKISGNTVLIVKNIEEIEGMCSELSKAGGVMSLEINICKTNYI